MCDLPGPGIEPVSPVLAGRLTTGPPRKPKPSLISFNNQIFSWSSHSCRGLECVHLLTTALHPQNVPQNSRHLTPRHGGSSLPQATADLISIYTWPTVVADLELHKCGVGPPALLCVWLLAFWMLIVRFIPVVVCVSGSFLFIAESGTLTSVWVLLFFSVPCDMWGQRMSPAISVNKGCWGHHAIGHCSLEINRILALDS